MKLETILPFIAPFCRSASEPTIYHHAKLAAVEFCKRTGLMQEELDPIEGDGAATEFDLIVPNGLEIARIEQVWIDDREVFHTTNRYGRRLVADGAREDVVWNDSRCMLTINPAPVDGAEIRVLVTLAPRIDTDLAALPDALAPHLQDISHGALSGILALKGPDQDLKMAMANRSMFENRVNTVGLVVSRSFSTARVPSRPRMF